MTTITNLAAIVSSLIVTSYSTNVVQSDNRPERTVPSLFSYGGQATVETLKEGCATERYEQITITEHKVAEVTLTNGIVLRQELTNRVVSDRIRTFKIISTEEFVGEKDAPQLVYGTTIYMTNAVVTNWWFGTNTIVIPFNTQP